MFLYTSLIINSSLGKGETHKHFCTIVCKAFTIIESRPIYIIRSLQQEDIDEEEGELSLMQDGSVFETGCVYI